MSTPNSDSASNSHYNTNDNFSKQIIKDINDFNKIKYQKRGASLSKMKNKNVDTAIRKLHHKYQPYGDNYKNLITLGETHENKIKNHIIALQKDEEYKSGINNPFTTSGGKKRVTNKKKTKLRKTKKLK
jgi:hypothetical protein